MSDRPKNWQDQHKEWMGPDSREVCIARDGCCVNVCDDADVGVEIYYPDRDMSKAAIVEVDLMDVRAADSIRIQYDFDRDGWVIRQASTFEWESGDEVCDPDWQEVAFIKAWAREKPSARQLQDERERAERKP